MYISCNYWTWQSYCNNKRVKVQTIYHYENFILDYNSLPGFHPGNCNSGVIKTQVVERHLHVIFYVVFSTELSFIFTTLVAYIHLLHFVQSQSRAISTKRHGGANLNKKLTLTVTYTYLCLLLFTLPQVAKQVIVFGWEKRMIVNLERRMIVTLEYWSNVLSFSNCYTNACIILYINRQNHEWKKE